jgi:HEAT repeat protein
MVDFEAVMSRCSQRPRLSFALAVAGLLCTTPASALDWAGKFQQDADDLRSPSPTVRLRGLQRVGRYPLAQARPLILKALEDPDLKVQSEAASQVAEHRIREAVPALIRWLSHWEIALRVAGAETLGKLADPRATRPLLRSLGDPENEVRLKVVIALGQIPSPERSEVVPLLGRINNDTDAGVRRAAVEALARKKDKRALIPLIARLSDTSYEVRHAAVLALGELADPGAGPALLRLIRDSNTTVSASAIEVLGKLRYQRAAEALIDLMQNGAYASRGQAANALGAIGTPAAIRALVAGLAKSASAASAKRALVEAGNRAARELSTLLQDPRSPGHVSSTVVEICREAKMTAALPALLEQLRLGRLPRVQVIRTLGQIGDRRAQRPLLELLEQSSYETRVAILEALDSIVDERAAEPLLEVLEDPSARVRLMAVGLLGRLRSRLATPALVKLATGKDPVLARAALLALARARDPRAAPALVKLLAHREGGMRRLSAQTLARLGSIGVLDSLLSLCREAKREVQITCFQALGGVLRGRTDERAYQLLAKAALENDRSLLIAALDALAAMRDSRIAPLLARRYPALDPPLRRKVLEALGQPAPEATSVTVPLLVKALADKEVSVRATAAWSLGKLGAPARQALAAIERAARDSRWEVRTNAAAALARIGSRGMRSLMQTLSVETSPYVRANATLGLAWAPEAETVAQLQDRLRADRSPWVRANALRGLTRLRPATPIALSDSRSVPSIPKLLELLASEDPDPRVRTVAEELRRPRPLEEGRWIGLYLLNQEEKPLRNDLFALITPSGLVRAAWSDGLGEAWEEGVEDGRCFVELPIPTLTGTDPEPVR